MTGPDATAQAALAAAVIRPKWVGYLDILGDPIRVTTAPYSIAFSGTGDADLDGYTFDAIDPTFVSVSPVVAKEGGGETVTATLSGLIGVDSDLMTQIGDKTNWQGRVGRLWQMLYDEDLERVGNIWPYYTGFMTVPKIVGDAASQTIALDIEGYLSFLTQASNRSYLNQADYDPGDLSAERSIAVANGTSGGGLIMGALGPFDPTSIRAMTGG